MTDNHGIALAISNVTVRPWSDPLVEACGFGPDSTYVEHCWLPVLGPTGTWAYRRLGALVEHHPDGIEIDLVELSVGLGLGTGLGRNSLLVRSLARLAHFHVLRWGSGSMLVRRALAPLTEAQLARLTPAARAVHDEAMGRPVEA